jgi:hypothetical protein
MDKPSSLPLSRMVGKPLQIKGQRASCHHLTVCLLLLRDQVVTEDSHNAVWNYCLKEGSDDSGGKGSDDGGDDGWRDSFEDGFEDGSALGEDLFCFIGFEGIDEGSDDGCDDRIEDGSPLVFELGFVEGSDHGWRYSIKTAIIILWWVERITKAN